MKQCPGGDNVRRSAGDSQTRYRVAKCFAGTGQIGFFEPFCQCSGEDDSRNGAGSQRDFLRRKLSSAGICAFLHDGGVQALAEFRGELVDFVLAIDGDGLAGGVEDDLAVVALADVGLDLGKECGVDFTVEVVGELGEEIGAGHGLGPPFFCLK